MFEVDLFVMDHIMMDKLLCQRTPKMAGFMGITDMQEFVPTKSGTRKGE